MPERGKDIFLSYSHKDGHFVRQLVSDFVERGVVPWVDETDLRPGDSIVSHVEKAIEGALIFVVVLSEHSLTSTWVKTELALAHHAEFQGRTKVITINLCPAEQITGFAAIQKHADFSRWPHDAEQYARSLKELLDAIAAYKEKYGGGRRGGAAAPTLPAGGSGARRLLPDILRDQLSLARVADWPLGGVFKGTFPVKKGYVDGADRVWGVGRKSVRLLAGKAPELQTRDNAACLFIGEDDKGRPWCLIERELFVFLEGKWVGVPLSSAAESRRVSLWKEQPPPSVLGPVILLSDRVSVLSASSWRWDASHSPIGAPQAASGRGASLLIANTDHWALTRSHGLGWDAAVRFTSRMPKPLSLIPQPERGGFWMHCADHTLFWVQTDRPGRAPLALGTKQGLPGARVDMVITRRGGEVWCAGSGGLAFAVTGDPAQFTVLSNLTPQQMWADGAGRVWALSGQEVWCWVEED